MHPNTREALRIARHPGELTSGQLEATRDGLVIMWLDAPWWRFGLRLRSRFFARSTHHEVRGRQRREALRALSDGGDRG